MKQHANLPQINFAFLEKHDPTLMRLGMRGERYFPGDPNNSMLKMRQYAELLGYLVETRPTKPLRIRCAAAIMSQPPSPCWCSDDYL